MSAMPSPNATPTAHSHSFPPFDIMASAMNRERQICPICGAANTIEVNACAICGARLSGTRTALPEQESTPGGFYDFEMGEDDLMAVRLPGVRLMLAVLVLLMLAGVIAAVYGLRTYYTQKDGESGADLQVIPTETFTPDAMASLLALTPSATLAPSMTRPVPPPLPTITPTPTATPEPGPCIVTVGEGDTLSGLVYQCNYSSFNDDLIALIMELNDLPNVTSLQIGQQLQIPLPTPTLDPAILEAAAGPTLEGSVTLDPLVPTTELSLDDDLATKRVSVLPTLGPGLMYHTVVKDQTMYDLIAIYNIDVKLLSEINPEIDFPQCDFGMQFGGPNCSPIFYEGQQLRVPAPSSTPTIPPTPSGSETPTPTATPTINIPSSFAPKEGTVLDAASVVTFRWTTTGTLGLNEVYKITLENLERDEIFIGFTCDLAFDIPPDWQSPAEEFEEFEWSVSVADLQVASDAAETYAVRSAGLNLCQFSAPLNVEWDGTLQDVGSVRGVNLIGDRYPTTPRRFFWQGRG
jgi:hypothetical protein